MLYWLVKNHEVELILIKVPHSPLISMGGDAIWRVGAVIKFTL